MLLNPVSDAQEPANLLSRKQIRFLKYRLPVEFTQQVLGGQVLVGSASTL